MKTRIVALIVALAIASPAAAFDFNAVTDGVRAATRAANAYSRDKEAQQEREAYGQKGHPEPIPAQQQAMPAPCTKDGRYRLKDGDRHNTIAVKERNGVVAFILSGTTGMNTGEVEGTARMTDATHGAYSVPGCDLRFQFAGDAVRVKQEGTCDAGLNVWFAGTYARTK